MTTLKEFRKQNQDLKGKKIYLCEHLKTKELDRVDINLYLGENTRILLCPVCQKYLVGTALEYAAKLVQEVRALSNDMDNTKYQAWLQNAGKDKT
jgi:hypothetical protein